MFSLKLKHFDLPAQAAQGEVKYPRLLKSLQYDRILRARFAAVCFL
jgi:hypothetical protein